MPSALSEHEKEAAYSPQSRANMHMHNDRSGADLGHLEDSVIHPWQVALLGDQESRVSRLFYELARDTQAAICS